MFLIELLLLPFRLVYWLITIPFRLAGQLLKMLWSILLLPLTFFGAFFCGILYGRK